MHAPIFFPMTKDEKNHIELEIIRLKDRGFISEQSAVRFIEQL